MIVKKRISNRSLIEDNLIYKFMKVTVTVMRTINNYGIHICQLHIRINCKILLLASCEYSAKLCTIIDSYLSERKVAYSNF